MFGCGWAVAKMNDAQSGDLEIWSDILGTLSKILYFLLYAFWCQKRSLQLTAAVQIKTGVIVIEKMAVTTVTKRSSLTSKRLCWWLAYRTLWPILWLNTLRAIFEICLVLDSKMCCCFDEVIINLLSRLTCSSAAPLLLSNNERYYRYLRVENIYIDWPFGNCVVRAMAFFDCFQRES